MTIIEKDWKIYEVIKSYTIEEMEKELEECDEEILKSQAELEELELVDLNWLKWNQLEAMILLNDKIKYKIWHHENQIVFYKEKKERFTSIT